LINSNELIHWNLKKGTHLKICFFSLNRLAFPGGAEKYIIEVGQELKRQKHQVFYLGDCRPLLTLNVLAGFFLGVASFKKTLAGLSDLKSLPSFPKEARGAIEPRKLKLISFLPFSSDRKKTKEFLNQTDLILVKNELLDMIGFFLLGPIRGSKKALLVFSSLSYPSKSLRGKVHNFFYTNWFYRFLTKSFDHLIVSNSSDAHFLKRKFKIDQKRVKYIPYGLVPKDFSFEPVPDPKHFRLLFVGRLEEQKGVDYLVKIIKNLSQEEFFKKLKITLIGDGPERKRIKALANDFPNVSWLGLLPRAGVKKAYNRHDLLLVTSRWETFSYVTLEAQFCGLPVISFDIPGPADILKTNKETRFAPLGDLQKYRQLIKNAFLKKASPQERKRIRAKAIKNFSVAKTAQHLLTLTS
jgi:glycosyltransferase involved in cell wall biosynthesis